MKNKTTTRTVLTLMLISGISLINSSFVYAESKSTTYWEDYYSSYNYENVGDWSNSIKALLILYKKHPTNYTLNLRLGYLYFADKKYANSIEHYENAIEAKPHSMSPLIGLIRVRNAQGQYTRSVEVGYRITNIDFYSYYGNLSLAYALRMSKKYELAEKTTLKLLALYPEDVSFLQEYALLQVNQGELNKATEAFNYVLLLDPENVLAKENLSALPKK